MTRTIVRHLFNIRAGKICLVEKRTSTAPILGPGSIARERRVAAACGKHDRFDGEENGLAYGVSLAVVRAHAACKVAILSLESDHFRAIFRTYAGARTTLKM